MNKTLAGIALVAVVLTAGCAGFPSLSVLSRGTPAEGVVDLLQNPSTDLSEIRDQVTIRVDRLDNEYDQRQQIAAGRLSAECIAYRQLVAEERIANIAQENFCRDPQPAPTFNEVRRCPQEAGCGVGERSPREHCGAVGGRFTEGKNYSECRITYLDR